MVYVGGGKPGTTPDIRGKLSTPPSKNHNSSASWITTRSQQGRERRWSLQRLIATLKMKSES
eukprot:scaffold12808_cov92-Amphora_coffeaeformis.AAC.1